MATPTPPAAAALLFLLLLSSAASRPVPLHSFPSFPSFPFAEAPQFRDGDSCPPIPHAAAHAADSCDPSSVHIAMTLDSHYLRGSVAAVYSLLKHASCPDHLFFHFVASANAAAGPSADLSATIRATFPSLRFALYPFSPGLVLPLISPSVRSALDNPLNYARNYLASLLPPCVHRVVYLDSDLVAADDIARLWVTSLPGSAVIAAPEYCHANFTHYFTDYFWANWGPAVFSGRRRPPCYFNTGVMVMDLRRWREGGYERRIERWMEVQREERIYDLGSLPPFLLVFAGEVEGVDHRWNQHGLGGDNVNGSCRPLHPGPASLLHWSGKGKPWDRLDAGRPCPVDHLWAPYDLYIRPPPAASSLW